VSLIEPGPVQSRFRENSYQLFKRHIDTEASPYRDLYEVVERRLAKEKDNGFFTLPETAVLEKLVHALEHPRPKPRYYVTVPTHVLGMLKRMFSSRMLDRVLLAASRAEMK
jgi:hypothetical protein